VDNVLNMKLGVALASLFMAGTAYAQAPGDTDEVAAEGEIAPPGMAAPVAPQPPPPPPPAPERRWSVGLGLGSLGLAPHHDPENETHFSIGQIAVRYRPWRHLELELALSGGGEKYDDGSDGDREVSSGVLALRYRFNPLKKWNLWLMAGMGGLTVSPKDATDEERKALGQSTMQFGVGLERRWTRFALQAELRAVGVAPIDGYEDQPVMTTQPVSSTMPVPPATTTYYGDGWKGGQLAITGNYYF